MATVLRAGAGRTELAVTSREVAAARSLAPRPGEADADRAALPIPPDLRGLIEKILAAVARGESITVGALPQELSTSVAAEQLGISRPTLMKILAQGDIPSHMVGTHTRVRTDDVIAFRRVRLERQRAAFEQLRVLEDELET